MKLNKGCPCSIVEGFRLLVEGFRSANYNIVKLKLILIGSDILKVKVFIQKKMEFFYVFVVPSVERQR